MFFATAGWHLILSNSIYIKKGVVLPMASPGMGCCLNMNMEVWEKQHLKGVSRTPQQPRFLEADPSCCSTRNHCCVSGSFLLSVLKPSALHRVEVALCPKARVPTRTHLASPHPEPYSLHCGFQLLPKACMPQLSFVESYGGCSVTQHRLLGDSYFSQFISSILAVASVCHFSHSLGQK